MLAYNVLPVVIEVVVHYQGATSPKCKSCDEYCLWVQHQTPEISRNFPVQLLLFVVQLSYTNQTLSNEVSRLNPLQMWAIIACRLMTIYQKFHGAFLYSPYFLRCSCSILIECFQITYHEQDLHPMWVIIVCGVRIRHQKFLGIFCAVATFRSAEESTLKKINHISFCFKVTVNMSNPCLCD